MSASAYQQSSNGQPRPDTTLARVTLRPIGSPLPLGAFTLVPAGMLLAGFQLGWFDPADAKAIPFLILGFAFPLQFLTSVLGFLGRDALVGAGFGIFAGVWLAFGLTGAIDGLGHPNPVLGVFFLSCGALFALLMAGGLAGGKVAAGAVILAGSARFILSGLYELGGSTGVERAAGIVGLVFVVIAAYVGLATLLEDGAHQTVLPIGRRRRARAAVEQGMAAHLDEVHQEAGVREQL